MVLKAHGLLLASLVAIVGGGLALHPGDAERPAEPSPRVRAEARAKPVVPRARAERRDERAPRRRVARVPTPDGLAASARYAAERDGLVSFAAIDGEGRLYGRDLDRLYSAASTVKAMLLAAELERLERERLPLDQGTDALLRSMITRSDNKAADAIYARVGDPGMFAVARRAEMTRFTEAGHWGNAQISAADLAHLYSRLEGLVAGPHREYALGLLGSVAPEQRWGIPAVAAERGWAVRFKGGWLPGRGLAHQGAQLRNGDRELALAVLTDAQPSHEYATETVQGVAARLLGGR
ncbi:MAG: serine hydrolase [Solirubrobacterales bacterium]